MPVPPAGQKLRHFLGSSLVALFALAPLGVPLSTLDAAAARSGSPEFTAGLPADQGPIPLSVGNPLAGRPWGVYKGPLEHSWHAYRQARGQQRDLLARIALRPKATWFGQWLRTEKVRDNVSDYVLNAQHGDPEALVQMAIFAIQPWEREACVRLPSAAEKAAFMRWVDEVALGIGDAHVALILQPDAPFALCAPHGSQAPLDLMRYATERFSQQPNTSVYIEVGAADWLRDDPVKALKILVPAGIASARGFALNSTHYDSTERQVHFAAAIALALASRGITGKYAVINTAQNGRPFKGYEYQGRNFDNARACASRVDSRCVTLGIPPTTAVADPAWGLSPTATAEASAYVDGYLWFGRPWLYNQASGWDQQRALTLARTTPYPGP